MLVNLKDSVFDQFRSFKKFINTCDSQAYLTIDPNSFICDGYLTECQKDGHPILKYCILTRRSLICCRITERESDCFLDNSENFEIILDWPVFKRVEIGKFLGFKLTTNDLIIHKFFFDSNNDISVWLEGLKQIAVQQNINLDYTFTKNIGKGGCALVQKGIHKITGKKVAIKCFEKSKLTENSNLLVFFHK